MTLLLLSTVLSCLLATVLLLVGLRRQHRIAGLRGDDPMRAYHFAMRKEDLRKGWYILGVLALYLVFVLTLAVAGLCNGPSGTSVAILVIALLFAGSLALLGVRYAANQPLRRRLLFPPVLLVLFGMAYPHLSDAQIHPAHASHLTTSRSGE